MKLPEDQAAFYDLLGKLLWYLGSGRSHVGYLSRCSQNPFTVNQVSHIVTGFFFDDRYLSFMILLS